MIDRTLQRKLLGLSKSFPVVSLTGPRQSGKTTLVRQTFTDLPYVSLENPDDRALALDDPRQFLENYPEGAILDEVQRVPKLFSYIQGVVDEDKTIKYVLSGSQNFLLNAHIGQSLAGRVGILKLLPLSLKELQNADLIKMDLSKTIYNGLYPGIYDRKIEASDFYSSYIHTYVERDVRQILEISNLNTFSTFLKLCAGRVGQLLNMSELANDVGVSVNSIKSWISVLESSYILFKLHPHYQNFSKRLIKMPKLYFYDTGLACHLLGIRKNEQVGTHFLKGALFENLIILELAKRSLNAGRDPNLYFWRDHKGKEIDVIMENGFNNLTPIEIKSGATKSTAYFDGLKYWNKLSGNHPTNAFVIYAGQDDQVTQNGKLIGWKSIIDHELP